MVTYDQLMGRAEEVVEYDHYFSMWCPYEDHKSMALLVFRDGWWRCLSCGRSGDYSRLWSKLRGTEGASTVRQVDSWTPPVLPQVLIEQESYCMEAHELLSNHLETLGWYLKRRGVLGRVESCRLGWTKGWYTIPVYDESHKFTGYVMRASTAIQKTTGRRFHMPRDMGGKLYVPDWHKINTSPYLIVVYGMFDALALSELRFPVVTNTSGKLGLKADWLATQRKPIYIIPDKDEHSAARTLAKDLGWRSKIIELEYEGDIKDPAGFVENDKKQQLISQITKVTGCQ